MGDTPERERSVPMENVEEVKKRSKRILTGKPNPLQKEIPSYVEAADFLPESSLAI